MPLDIIIISFIKQIFLNFSDIKNVIRAHTPTTIYVYRQSEAVINETIVENKFTIQFLLDVFVEKFNFSPNLSIIFVFK